MAFTSRVDSGWAWVVVIASFFAHFICFGIAWTTGVFHVIFLEEFGASNVVTSWAGSLMPACMFLAGPVASILINRLGCRLTMIIGSLMSSCGLIISYFAPSVVVLCFTFGILTGFGFGICHLAAISSVTFYFNKRRNIATGFAVTGVGVGTIALPPLIRFFVSLYTWRGTMLMLGAISLNLSVCASLIRPIHRPELKKVSDKAIDTSIFHKVCYWMLCLNSFFVCFGLSVTYIHLTTFAETCGIDFEKSALLVSGIGVANVIGRLTMGLLAQHPRVNIPLLYLVSFIIAGVAVTLMPAFKTFPGLLVLSIIFGCFTAGIGTLIAPILAKILGIHRFAGGYGCLALINGFGQMTGGPTAGLMYDLSGTYLGSFLLGGLVLILSSLFMILPLRYKKRQRFSFRRAIITHDVQNDSRKSSLKAETTLVPLNAEQCSTDV